MVPLDGGDRSEKGRETIVRSGKGPRVELAIAVMKARDALERILKSLHPGDFFINKYGKVGWIIEVIPAENCVTFRGLFKPDNHSPSNLSATVGTIDIHDIRKISGEELTRLGYIVPEGPLPKPDVEED